MRSGFWRRLGPCILLLWGLTASAQTNGIFADFTTSMGNFTCQLSYSNAPETVANFIGLATGQRAWLDLVTGQVRTNAFYDGVIFHRIISGFMIQGGAPNGLGADGPGYAFVDEFSPLLTFSSPWVLAMANSGPDSNGSQFFVTVEPYTSGNNTYAIFGRVISGTNVVVAINHVATDANNKPLTNVVIQHLSIRRVGTAAEAFDINAHGLPLVTNIPVALKLGSQQASLTFSNRLYADNRWYWTTNLSTWNASELGIEVSGPGSNSVLVAMDSPQKFFRFAQVQYASSTFAPQNVYGKTLVLNFAQGRGTHTIVFDQSGGGTYKIVTTIATTTGSLSFYIWSQGLYTGQFYPLEYGGILMTLQLNFSSAAGGSFTGTVYSTPSFSVYGTFTLSP
jgi:peptidyl-prolyl cis-trans isomerase A (cyclophilin A)